MGSLLEEITELQGGQSALFLLVAVLVTAVVTIAVTIIARRQLHRMRVRALSELESSESRVSE
jgi:cell division protein FtsL